MCKQKLKDDLKYIRTEDRNGMDHLLLFPVYVLHADAARGKIVHSAGFVDVARRECHGDSTSLGLKSCTRDTMLLRVMFRKPLADAA